MGDKTTYLVPIESNAAVQLLLFFLPLRLGGKLVRDWEPSADGSGLIFLVEAMLRNLAVAWDNLASSFERGFRPRPLKYSKGGTNLEPYKL